MTTLVAAVVVGGGLALVVISVLVRAHERDVDLAELLDLDGTGAGGADAAGVAGLSGGAEGGGASAGGGDGQRGVLVETGVTLAQSALEGLNLGARVGTALERARIPLRPGEFVLAATGAGVGGGLLTWLYTGQPLVGGLCGALIVWLSWRLVLRAVSRRRKAFESQFPEAISLIASSLQAGHTFLRAIQMMVEESTPPLSEEFERVVAETRLGDPLVDALARMADRLDLPDLAWVVQAIRIQQEVGGKLADLLFTLADFMRAREEVRREVRVLTAEGRASAYVMGGLPVFTFLAIKSVAPGYMSPLLHGAGLFALLGAAASVAMGVFVIMRMVRVEL